MSVFDDTDSDDGTIIIDGGPGDIDVSERTNSGFNPDAHEVVDVYDSSDEEEEEYHKFRENEEAGFFCPICRRNTTEKQQLVQCSRGHRVCKECLRRYLSFKGLKVGDPGLSCCQFVWCHAKY